jgi:hypothetical protein
LGFVCLASLWQLHRIDPKVPRDEQFGAIKTLLDLGVIRNVGLSEVSVPEIEAASSEAQMLEQCRHVGLIARDAVQSLREHNVEPATLGVLQQRLDTRPKNDTGTGDGGVMIGTDDLPTLPARMLTTDAELVLDGHHALIVGRVAGVKRNLVHGLVSRLGLTSIRQFAPISRHKLIERSSHSVPANAAPGTWMLPVRVSHTG